MLMDIARETEDSSEIINELLFLTEAVLHYTPPKKKKTTRIKDSNIIFISLCIFYICIYTCTLHDFSVGGWCEDHILTFFA